MHDDLLSEFDQRYGVLYKEMELVLTQANQTAELRLAPHSIKDGHLGFMADIAFETRETAFLAVHFFGRSFDVDVLILRCENDGNQFYLQLQITAEIALKARILLQLAEIVHYRKKMLHQGRDLTVDEAAAEWIARYAEGFAAEFDKHINT